MRFLRRLCGHDGDCGGRRGVGDRHNNSGPTIGFASTEVFGLVFGVWVGGSGVATRVRDDARLVVLAGLIVIPVVDIERSSIEHAPNGEPAVLLYHLFHLSGHELI